MAAYQSVFSVMAFFLLRYRGSDLGVQRFRVQRFKVQGSEVLGSITNVQYPMYNERKSKMGDKTKEYNLEDRLINFAVSMIDIVEALPNTRASNHIAGQFVRSGTSPASNYGEAQSAESRKDFIHKIGIVLKESCESNYWIRVSDAILNESSKTDVFNPIINESFEFEKIFSSIKLTANNI